MPRRLERSAVARIEDVIVEHLNDPYISNLELLEGLARDYHTTIRTIYRHIARVSANMPPQRFSGGAPRYITWEMECSIKLVLDQQPWLYLDEIRDFIFEAYGVYVCLATICNTLRHIKVTRKKLKVEASQRNDELRNQWLYDLQFYSASQLVFVDESGSDDRTGDRFYGWSTEGSRAVVRRWLQNRDRVSVLPAYTIEGYIASQTFYGTCDGEIFESFIIDRLLPLCNPFPGPRSVIVMDNASIHQSPGIYGRSGSQEGRPSTIPPTIFS